MRKNNFMLFLSTALIATSILTSCGNNGKADEKEVETSTNTEAKIKTETVSYKVDSVESKSYIAYNENQEGKRPAVLIIPEWWGLGEYVQARAKQLADMGYFAMAVDMYGNGQTAEDPGNAQKLATPFYVNPQLTKIKIDAALEKLKDYPQADLTNVAAIGYCFGGYSVINAAKLGAELKGVVSFHGNLSGVSPKKELLKAKILVCHGAADNFVPDAEVAAFKKSMDSVGASYTFKAYPNATHAFTNPNADEKAAKFKMPIKYDRVADSTSWSDMKAFFATIFPKK